MTRGRGRPRSFDPGMALRQVFAIFRRHGYAATSLDDIAQATGLNRPSLYSAFGDKRSMYLATLAMVADSIAASADKIDATDTDLRGRLEIWLDGCVEAYMSGENGPGGCLALSTAVAESVSDAEIRAALERILALIDERVARWFELAGTDDPMAHARLVAAIMHSMSVRARAGQPRQVLEEMAREALRHLVPPSR
jgi:AcrR family transcriptional regulator